MAVDLRSLKRLEKAFAKASSELASGSGPGGGTGKRILKALNGLDAKQSVQVFKREMAPGSIGRTGSLSRAKSNRDAAKWKALTGRYAKWKRENSSSRKKLVLDGGLKKSLTSTRGTGRIARLDGNVVTLGTSNKLGAIHMAGVNGTVTVTGHSRNDPEADRGVVAVRAYAYTQRIPARPMVGKTHVQMFQLQRAVVKIVQDRLGSILGGPVGRDMKRDANRIKPNPRYF